MRRSRELRARVSESLLSGGKPAPGDVGGLQAILRELESIPGHESRRTLSYDGKSLGFDLSYEIGELRKDLLYLEAGEEALLARLAEIHPQLPTEVSAGLAFLNGFLHDVPRHSLAFVTDRDGTVNNYCGRYYSSVQSAYNAVFLSRFALGLCRRSVILTSAPLEGGGLVDVSVVPPRIFALAGSKGREALDEEGARHRLPIPQAQQAELDRLNRRLARLLEQPEFEIFGLIGSGLQFKFGQSTIALQDVHGSIPDDLSQRFRGSVQRLIQELDPDGRVFRTEDTGKDLEILLTVEDTQPGAAPEAAAGGGGALRDFDKGDGVRYLDRELGLGLQRGPTLVCGDTPSDLPMVKAALQAGGRTCSIFVTRDDKLRGAVQAVCPQSWFATEPDVLVALLHQLERTHP
jgi:hypothetical protein